MPWPPDRGPTSCRIFCRENWSFWALGSWLPFADTWFKVIKVLVIDDEPDVRFLLRVNLEADGFAVGEASSGEALSVAWLDRPDAIILDLMMPGMDGWEMLAHLKADPFTQDIPVIIVTARAGFDDRQQVLEKGAAAFVSKPFDPRAVGEQVRALLKAS